MVKTSNVPAVSHVHPLPAAMKQYQHWELEQDSNCVGHLLDALLIAAIHMNAFNSEVKVERGARLSSIMINLASSFDTHFLP